MYASADGEKITAIYMTATALGRLGHPDGEKCLTWAGAKQDIIQMVRRKAPSPVSSLTNIAPITDPHACVVLVR